MRRHDETRYQPSMPDASARPPSDREPMTVRCSTLVAVAERRTEWELTNEAKVLGMHALCRASRKKTKSMNEGAECMGFRCGQ